MTDDVTSARLTSTPTVRTAEARTAAATAARRRAATGKLALEVACRLGELDDERLVALASQLVIEAVKRGVGDRICA